MTCLYCPRKCGADREIYVGYCGMGKLPVVAKACLHHWEEPCISGTGGSGTVFFSGCNLKCVFCQNYNISHDKFGREITVEKLADIFLMLQKKGAHNINLVTPSHFVPQIRLALDYATGLSIPVVYNSNGYDSIDSLKIMEGYVGIYLPDLKYFNPETAAKYSGAKDYFDIASAAIKEMYRQTGAALLDKDGIMKRGVIIRHLILPGYSSESVKLLDWLKANMPEDIHISLMSQYTPYNNSCLPQEINRRITAYEYDRVVGRFYKLGFKNGYIQDRESASEEYIPDFNLEGLE